MKYKKIKCNNHIKNMNLKKYNFHFPATVLKEEDFFPVETFLFKDYYRQAFLDYIDKVITKNI